MKANVQKTLKQLSPSALKQLDEWYLEKRDEDIIVAQFRWIKLGIRAMASNPKITTEDLLAWIVALKRLYQLNARFKNDEELDSYLNREMDRIFGEGKFPEEFVQNFRKI